MDVAGLSQEHAQWLEEARKIPSEVAARCGVVSVGDRIAFEYRRDGRLQYRKIRQANEDGTKSFVRDRKGVETCLFLEDVIQTDPDPSSPLVVTEGEIDALSLIAAGVPNVVSVPDGAQLDALGEGKIIPEDDKAFGWLWGETGLKPHLAQFQTVILAVDADHKGRILREELAVRFERNKCFALAYPEGCKDANEVLVKFGSAALAQLVADARPLVPNRLVRFSELVERGTGEIFPSGFKGLDDQLRFAMVAPELMVISGAPGSGKSEFAAILGANLANHSKLPGAIMQFEDRTSRVRETLVRYAMSNVPDISDRAAARGWVNNWFRTVEPEQDLAAETDYDLRWLFGTLREARVRHGCRWVIIDPWNELEHMWDRTQTEAVYTNDALRKLKRLSRALQIILIIVTHPSKEGGREKSIADMDLYSIAGSAAWANKADHGIILHRPDKSKEDVYVKVAKSKDHWLMGVPGIVRMKYLPASARFNFVGMGV